MWEFINFSHNGRVVTGQIVAYDTITVAIQIMKKGFKFEIVYKPAEILDHELRNELDDLYNIF